MGVMEAGTRVMWRGMMRVAEHRIGKIAELGRPLDTPISGAPPVVLNHGFGNDHTAMGAIKRSLDRDGFQTFDFDMPEFGYNSARDSARALDERVAEVRRLTGSDTVDVVGHSLGGVVARLWQQEHASAPAAGGRVVTLNSGNGGIHLGAADSVGALLLPDGMKQIRRGSDLIESLHATRGTHDQVAVGTTKFDGVLMPASSARIEGAPFIPVDEGRTIGPFSRVGHYGILRDDTAYEAIRGALLLPR